ncbi:MAG: PTS sugar transporter subunit IIA [Solobacterium sp.]|nr:PTS sugar transporter subunit IIA [Solobacterium sp.]MCH4265337.1 PTS sugar transporter subunit IIA [Solobacterium sp.]
MRKFFISSHGHLASGMKTSLEILLGNADNVTVFDAYVTQDSVESQVEKWLSEVSPDDQAIMLSDLYGGSVNQVLYRYLDRPNTMLVAGINLALVLELVAASDQPITSAELDEVVSASSQTMQQCHLDSTEVKEEEFF